MSAKKQPGWTPWIAMPLLAVLLAVLPAILLSTCAGSELAPDLVLDSLLGSASREVDRPGDPPLLPLEVDSVVVRPFKRANGVELNDADLALFTKHLREALAARERVRVFESPPTLLPNTAVLAGRLERLRVDEREGGGLVLRTVELEAELQVLPATGENPLRSLRRSLAWQKAYPGRTVSGLALDLEDAARELTAQLAQALLPLPADEALMLRDGREGKEGAGGHPALRSGNRHAVNGAFEKAKLSWRRVLFDPSLPGEAGSYRLGTQSLNRLRSKGLSEDLLQRLAPLAAEPALPLVEFRAKLRAAAGEVVAEEGLILTLSDASTASAHRNIAAAHANLAAVAHLELRDDLAAYHWARAWAHNPDPATLERWRALQLKRKVLSANLTDEQAMDLYLRLPAPSTARVRPGVFELEVLPQQAFPELGTAVTAADGQADALQPTPLGQAPASATDTGAQSAVQSAANGSETNPGRATGSGPSGAEGPPSAAQPPSPSAPAAR